VCTIKRRQWQPENSFYFFQINRLLHVFSFSLLFFSYVFVCVLILPPPTLTQNRLFTRWERAAFCGLCMKVYYRHSRTNAKVVEKNKKSDDDATKIWNRKEKKKGRKANKELLFLHIYRLLFLVLLLFFNDGLYSSWKWRQICSIRLKNIKEIIYSIFFLVVINNVIGNYIILPILSIGNWD
jgi:hypothetical protein